MSLWSDVHNDDVREAFQLATGSLRDAHSWEAEELVLLNGARRYRLTCGNLFGSASVRYPLTENGLRLLLRDVGRAGESLAGSKPLKASGDVEPRAADAKRAEDDQRRPIRPVR